MSAVVKLIQKLNIVRKRSSKASVMASRQRIIIPIPRKKITSARILLTLEVPGCDMF